MATLRTYIAKNSQGVTVTVETERVDAERVRVKEIRSGTAAASQVLTNAEAAALVASLGALLSPPPPPPPPPPDPDPVPSGATIYDPAGPWNTPIPAGATVHPESAKWMAEVAKGPILTADPDQYAGPIYRMNLKDVPARRMTVNGLAWHEYRNGDQQPLTRSVYDTSGDIPLPAGDFPASDGSDAHVIWYDAANGIECGVWQYTGDGFTNGYWTRTTPGNLGAFKDGKSGRGAGTPYGAGCFRREDMEPGTRPHALAIPLNMPRPSTFVPPATKTDGKGVASAPPEGARLRIKASYQIPAGTHPIAARIIQWLQSHGGYVIDCSGRSKVYLEDRLTARWDSAFEETLGVPWSAFEFVA